MAAVRIIKVGEKKESVAVTNHERVGKALDLLKDALAPFVERELKADFCQTERALVSELRGRTVTENCRALKFTTHAFEKG